MEEDTIDGEYVMWREEENSVQSFGGKTGSIQTTLSNKDVTFKHRASCILGQAFHYSPENAFYIFNQQIYFII